jgi:hypothetical protein
MVASKAKIQYMDNYNRENYEKITLQVKKGTRAEWRRYAEERDLSMVGFISKAVNKYVNEDNDDE